MNYYLTKDTSLEIKDVDDNKGIVIGYLSRFGNVDSDGDRMIKGAFKKSINENGPESSHPRIAHLFQHNPNIPIGKFMRLEEDEKGLLFESKISKTPQGKDVLTLYKEGILKEHSIGFNILDDDMDDDGVREIKAVKLWEGSVVTFGANSDTPVVDIKSMTREDAVDKIDMLTKFIRDGKYTEETFDLLEIQLQQIKQWVSLMRPEEDSTYEPKELFEAFREGIYSH